ncbi:MarR family winged helix-turn-helix transcriptional regulator [Cytobacillus solani]|uniref:MarR family transcriptional regulator n=1 Tax=Cytobacillus solani TaxID=1637975 RepID=A0A0Q3QK71_9BACI|nr:MarR family transcriptional regulator [Cytobacillus solani]KOP71095.1 MarR family transcriptional regulator [Bacillus sp. FJAT-21945]KQL17960.1 MarR family transcriptional regulator [Cytobacillus solani]USK55784.1 MarR family transcriptional regulator [Cytobacillus solani]
MNENQSKFFHSINQFTRHFSKSLNEVLVPLGLYSAQWTIIYLLKTKGPATQKDLSLYLGVEAPTMTRTLARLELAGWISKVPGTDKREKKIILTDAAIQKYDEWLEAVRSCEKNLLKNVGNEEISSMMEIIEKMNRNL